MLKILTNIHDGNGKKGDIELLEEIAEVTGAASLCALGKTAADPLLSTLRYFKDEYEEKIAKTKSSEEKRE
jgi:NADH:ubiquinone oxidoreductase subunit F (NADH-binding)